MDVHAEAAERMARAVLETPGDLDTTIRQAIEAHAERLGGREATAESDVPADASERVPDRPGAARGRRRSSTHAPEA